MERDFYGSSIILSSCCSGIGERGEDAGRRITLNFSADIQAGDSEAYIDVSVEDGSCSVESADFVNEQEYWAGGVRPKVEIWLEADSDCYFKKSGKSAFTFTGDDVSMFQALPSMIGK